MFAATRLFTVVVRTQTWNGNCTVGKLACKMDTTLHPMWQIHSKTKEQIQRAVPSPSLWWIPEQPAMTEMAGGNINDFGSASVTERRWGFIQTWIWKVEEVSYQVLRCERRLYFSGASTPSPAQLFKYTSLWKAGQVGSETGEEEPSHATPDNIHLALSSN